MPSSTTFPSKPRRTSGPIQPKQQPAADPATPASPQPPPLLRSLPSFGSPNEFPNPPTHFFPSRPGAFAKSRAAQAAAAAAASGEANEDERSLPAPPAPALSIRSTSSLRSRDRVTWDAGSELMREEEAELAGAGAGGAAAAPSAQRTQGSEETVTTRVGGKRKTSPEEQELVDELDQDGDDDMMDVEGGGSDAGTPAKTSPGDDAASSSAAGKESAKKRSRTLTTAHQTAVLNALLAKTRFPSTETREEVGKQIGMSARRVQIWFQNRRQSQKRARDREAVDVGSAAGMQQGPYDMYYAHNPPQHAQPQQQHLSHQQRASPYGQYAAGPPSASTASTARPSINRHASMDSVNSFASAHSSVSSFHPQQQQQQQQARDAMAENAAPRWPGYPSHPNTYANGWHQPPGVQSPTSEQASRYSGAYFPPHAQPSSSVRSSLVEQPHGGPADNTRLPSLSSVLGAVMPDSQRSAGQQSPQQASARPPVFPGSASAGAASQPSPFASSVSSFSPPSRAPAAAPFPTRAPDHVGPGGRAILSPGPLSPTPSRPFEDVGFSRLRISSEAPMSPPPQEVTPPTSQRQGSPPDILDAAMELVYRPSNINPPRSSLPPLRLSAHRSSIQSEADAALLAPILPVGGRKNSQQLPSISSLTSSAGTIPGPPAHPFPSRGSVSSTRTAQQQPAVQHHTIPHGGTSTTWTTSSLRNDPPPAPPTSSSHTRSSLSSVDTRTGWTWGASPSLSLSARPQDADREGGDGSRTSLSTSATSSLGDVAVSGPGSFSSEVQEEWRAVMGQVGAKGRERIVEEVRMQEA